jgi:carboxymethylenebutenolidase
MEARADAVEVESGAVPVQVLGPEDARSVPGLVVVPSIFGPAPDLLASLASLADAALVVVPDPFWHEGGGVVPYTEHEDAVQRLRGFERDRCFAEMRAVIEWTRNRCNDRVAGLGICFGGPVMLTAAGEGSLDGLVTWHGSRMESYLDRAKEITCPLRFHFGEADPVTPPDAVERIRAAFAHHPDASFVVHPGLVHGFSHEGPSYDAAAASCGIEATRDLLAKLVLRGGSSGRTPRASFDT